VDNEYVSQLDFSEKYIFAFTELGVKDTTWVSEVSGKQWKKVFETIITSPMPTKSDWNLACQLIFYITIAPYQPLLHKTFKEQVLDFAIKGHYLEVRTNDGVWLFKCKGDKIIPKRRRTDGQHRLPFSVLEYPRTDKTKTWQIQGSDSKGFSLWHKNKNEEFMSCYFPENEGSQYEMCMVSNKNALLISTPLGIAEYEPKQKSQLANLTPLRQGISAVMEKLANKVYICSSDGSIYHINLDTNSWNKVQSPCPNIVASYGIRWQKTMQGDEFLQNDFDPIAKCFLADSCIRLMKDNKDRFWFLTKAGWRLLVTDGDNIILTRPTSKRPQEANPVTQP